MSRLMKSVSAAAITALVGFGASQSHAATVLHTGDMVDGYVISFPVGISLTDDGGGHLTLEKFAAFNSLEGLDITFNQVSYTASSKITITDESITNKSGVPFTGFQFLLQNELTGNGKDATLMPNAFITDGTAPFTTQVDTPDSITLGGGVLGNNQTAKWGFGATGGELTINANPQTMRGCQTKVFELKEIPINAVPLPAAGWTGLSGLLGLGLMAHAKKLRKALA